MNERIKGELKASDDEWKVIQPLLEKVQELVMKERMQGYRGPRGGRFGEQAQQPQDDSAIGQLRKTLETPNASAEDIKAKIEAVREERKKAATELKSAREELRKVLTARQEAVLLSMSVLD